MSRHRGAKHRRRYELLGGISLLSPEYLLSVERWPFHTEPPDHYDLLSHLLDLWVSQSSHAYAIALLARCPTVPSVPSYSSVTFWEETAPVKLPTMHGPQIWIHRPWLEPQTNQGGISRMAPPETSVPVS